MVEDRNRVKIVKSAPPLECLNETYETKKTNSKKKITINKKYRSKNTQEMAIIFNSYSILSQFRKDILHAYEMAPVINFTIFSYYSLYLSIFPFYL